MKTIKVLEVTPLPFGCELRREIVRSPGFTVIGDLDDPDTREIADLIESAPGDIEWVAAYAPDGGYIGNEAEARRLIEHHGIAPQLAKAHHNVCSIGWCEKEQKWYGWSHRAIYGFGVLSVVKMGDCAYRAPSEDAFGRDMMNFFCDDNGWMIDCRHRPYVNSDGVRGVLIEATYTDKVPNEKLHGTAYSHFQPYPDEFGRGEWVAETLEDAKQMAIDFADGVS